MELKPEQLPRRLAGEPLRPVYLIAGSEPLRTQECADAVRAQARAEGYSEREIFDVDASFDWDTLAAGFQALSLFATRRVFDVRLPTAKPGKDGATLIAEFCANPVPDTVLLLTGGEWSNAHRGKWVDAITGAGHFVPVWPLKPHELPGWLDGRMRARGLHASRDAVELLVERVEGNLLAAAQEIDKLALLMGAGEAGAGSGGRHGVAIDAKTMLDVVADSARYDVFALVEAALGGEPARAVRMLATLRAEGEQVPGLMGWVSGELGKVAGFAATAARGGNVAAEMKAARIWDSKQALYTRALARHSAGRWASLAIECGRIDRMAKGRLDGDPWLTLERLLVAVGEAKAVGLVA